MFAYFSIGLAVSSSISRSGNSHSKDAHRVSCGLLSPLLPIRIFLLKVSFNHPDVPDLRRHVLRLHQLQHEVVGVGPQLHEARPALRPHAAPVVLVFQILDTLEVEGLDDAVIAKVELGAAASPPGAMMEEPSKQSTWLIHSPNLYGTPGVTEVMVKSMCWKPTLLSMWR